MSIDITELNTVHDIKEIVRQHFYIGPDGGAGSLEGGHKTDNDCTENKIILYPCWWEEKFQYRDYFCFLTYWYVCVTKRNPLPSLCL